MDNHSGHTARLHVGKPPRGFQPLDVAEVHFHGFKNLPIESKIETPGFTRIGNQWYLILYPGDDEDSDDGMIAVWLSNRSNHRVDYFSHLFAVRDTSRGELAIIANEFSKFGPQGGNEECGCEKYLPNARHCSRLQL